MCFLVGASDTYHFRSAFQCALLPYTLIYTPSANETVLCAMLLGDQQITRTFLINGVGLGGVA